MSGRTYRAVLLTALVAALAVALPGLARADGGGVPPKLFKKNYRVDVSLQDVQDGVFDATLTGVAASVPYDVAEYLANTLGSSIFDVDATAARCFVASSDGVERVDCSHVAELVDGGDGETAASILARPALDADGDLGFAAKKITVWSDDAPPAAEPPADPPADDPPPPKFFRKNFRLSVGLEDVQDLVFDATLGELAPTIPASIRSWLGRHLDSSTFEVDATHARCFVGHEGAVTSAPCAQVVALLEESGDALCATILARPIVDENGDLGFAAKKLTVWL